MIVAAIAAVFTIGYVANMLGEDGVTAFTEYGIECLRQIIADERAAGDAPPQVKPTE
jgi:hypothetical protein